MNSHAAAFSVLSTPVAICDRRALSEAWFAALHLHKDAQQNAPQHRAARIAAVSATTSAGAAAERAQPAALLPSRTLRSGAGARVCSPEIVERRSERSKLARQIVRTFARHIPPKHASFALGADRGRVQILLRSDGSYVQLVALCQPSARGIVGRALADARYALALRGITLGSEVRGFVRA